MRYIRISVLLTLLMTLGPIPAYAAEVTPKNASAIPDKAQEAHDFLAYLVKSEVIALDVKPKCSNWNSEPKITQYIQESCSSVFRVTYVCDNGMEKHIADTRVDWRYVSEITQAQGGYDKDGKDITLSGKIATTYSEDGEGESANMGKAKSTQQAKISFDSSKTAKRALNAFAQLKSECDTSAEYSF